jgi:hypothetical protein
LPVYQSIAGRIRTFWEQNGGLPVFGLPITAQQDEQIEGKPLQVQWFERNRLELHPENPRPYDVLIGRLGADRLAQQGRDWFTFAKSEAQASCRFFPETGHNICGDMLAAWRASGLELDGRRSKSEAENLALFGLPLSDAQTETIAGKEYSMQWFERARFELHPENKPPYHVLLGLLGNEVHGPAKPVSAPVPPPADGFDGVWNGKTSQGAEIHFTVKDHGFAAVSVNFSFPFSGCSISGPTSFFRAEPIPFAGNTFSVMVSSHTTVAGSFTSNTIASGTLHIEVREPACTGNGDATWSATRQ